LQKFSFKKKKNLKIFLLIIKNSKRNLWKFFVKLESVEGVEIELKVEEIQNKIYFIIGLLSLHF
jgi:hypothetical protein